MFKIFNSCYFFSVERISLYRHAKVDIINHAKYILHKLNAAFAFLSSKINLSDLSEERNAKTRKKTVAHKKCHEMHPNLITSQMKEIFELKL